MLFVGPLGGGCRSGLGFGAPFSFGASAKASFVAKTHILSPHGHLEDRWRNIDTELERLDSAGQVGLLRSIEESARRLANAAKKYQLDRERALGQLLTLKDRIQVIRDDRPLASTEPLPVDEAFASSLPELSPDVILSGIAPDDSGHFVEIHPSTKHPGYYHVAVYRDLDTDNAEVVYDRRPGRYTKELVAHVLDRVHGVKPTWWASRPADGTTPWFLRAVGKPGRVHRTLRQGLAAGAGQHAAEGNA